ncbi:MAG: hypothetical protein ACM3ZV_08015 [Bacillota bacterium]
MRQVAPIAAALLFAAAMPAGAKPARAPAGGTMGPLSSAQVRISVSVMPHVVIVQRAAGRILDVRGGFQQPSSSAGRFCIDGSMGSTRLSLSEAPPPAPAATGTGQALRSSPAGPDDCALVSGAGDGPGPAHRPPETAQAAAAPRTVTLLIAAE